MSRCITCNAYVGCSCSLIHGQCVNCRTSSKATVSYTQSDSPPVIGFDEILNNTTMTKQEKLRRINEILERAKEGVK